MASNYKLVRILKSEDADVNVASTSATITLDGLQCGGSAIEIEDVLVRVITAFTGGAVASLLLDIGKGGSLEKYAKDVDIFTASGSFLGSNTTSVKPRHVEASGVAPVFTLTSTGANLSACTVGEAHIFIKYGTMPNV